MKSMLGMQRYECTYTVVMGSMWHANLWANAARGHGRNCKIIF